MKKHLNFRNIIIILVILAILHFGTGFFLSPMLSNYVIGKINKYSGLKISIEKVNIWPLTLSVGLSNLKIFDPDEQTKRIAQIKSASLHISPLGLLSKRIVLSSIKIKGAEINVEGEPDGTFNIQKITKAQTAQEQPKSPSEVIDEAFKHKDLYSRAYNILKKKFSKESLNKQKSQGAQAKKTTKVVASLPKGRRVEFKSAQSYFFEVQKFALDGKINLKSNDGRSIEVDDARVDLNNLAFDPKLGSRIQGALFTGELKNAGFSAGRVKFLYSSSLNKGILKGEYECSLKDVDMQAVRFIYEDSLPVDIEKGKLDLESRSVITDGNIDSSNKIVLSGQVLKPKGGSLSFDGGTPLPIICEVLNGIDPINLKFSITGTVDKPQFKGFTESLMELVKPNMKNIGNFLKNNAADIIGQILEKNSNKDSSKQKEQIIDSIQSIFGTNKESSSRNP
ncbi:MAG: AsmA family protein [Candidatus Omnitrophota bacterium]